MKPETSTALANADHAISNAHAILAINIADQAARLAYYAQFYAAQALIFERTGKVAKTHKGVNKEFHRLIKTDPAFPPRFATQLTKAYDFKEIADYSGGSARLITASQASKAITAAERFVTVIRDALMSAPPAQSDS